ncbi:Tc toxin subunit A-related protein [Gordonia rhizosphera]|uniref:Tc toxin complex TcA C-terminal TcB-binding domain-containing protein n=1 Tax=Gordonia rhizosphera NBRC 16068 TaxID=1108045 RepID=K6X532_9ACTN|nr:hypothetical protein [Gordonia rhizosphera]GAB93889.1 hypothetical protein GORHZ_247_00270 [Gordonia rhizosphera NBRC 16068]
MAYKATNMVGFHAFKDEMAATDLSLLVTQQESAFTYTFENFFHPFAGELIEKLNKESLSGLLDPQFLGALGDVTKTPSSRMPGSYYDTTSSSGTKLVKTDFHDKQIDVTLGGPYANYNWELFFHVPLTIAVHLSKNQRFAEAQRWFHFIFNPTANDTNVDVPERYWRFIAFRKGGAGKQVDELLTLLSKPTSELDVDEMDLKAKILNDYEKILDHPFQPHRVARSPGRHLAYMYCVVMKYLDNLFAWGDQLFRQDTLESINEATQIYVLAANILGTRPEKVPLQGRVRPKTFAQLKKKGLDQGMHDALVELEGLFPFNLGMPTGSDGADTAAPLFGIGRTLYFCIPHNDRLLSYWDTAADRLFKIRHCMNIEGVVRPLALFDPPLDPGMLVKAAAAGIDIGAIVAGLNQPVSPVRSQLLIQKALELSAEVRGLGSSLLQSIEKEDAERLAVLRQGHEIKIQQLQQEVRFLQWKQAQESTESLLKSRSVVLGRYKHYLRLMSQEPNPNLVPDSLPADRRELTEENFDETYAELVGQYEKEIPLNAYPKLDIEGGGSPTIEADAEGKGNLSLITAESDEISHLKTARDLGLAASFVDAAATAAVYMPDIHFDFHYWGIGGTTKLPVGTAIVKALEITAQVLRMKAAWDRDQAGLQSLDAAHTRRADDWILQANSAALELRQIGRQLISSLIAEQVAQREYENTQRQIEQSQEVDLFLREKFTSAELYAWMQGELSRLYYEYYRFAFDVARRAEQTMKRELMRPELDSKTLIKFNYWDGGRRGLLSGEALYLDVKRMEMAYHEHNLRELELTKHVSLRQLDPLALLSLKVTRSCEVSLPEWFFDLDGPGHYMRRVRNVAVTVPAVTGPYTSVNCTLSLLKSSIRKSPTLTDGGQYGRTGSEDGRFVDSYGTIQSIVTSEANNDSGMHNVDLRDDRFLPFEGAGAVSTWRIELPPLAQFDYDSIADVVLHLRYTARDGGAQLRQESTDAVTELLQTAGAAGMARLFSLRHEFPSEWHRFANGNYDLRFSLCKDHFPYLVRSEDLTLEGLQLYRRDGADDLAAVAPAGLDLDAATTTLNDEGQVELALPEDTNVLTRDATDPVFLVVRYSVA